MNISNSTYEYMPLSDVSCSQEFYDERKKEILFKIFGYRKSTSNAVLYHCFGILFLGLPYLFYALIPKCRILKYKYSPLEDATILLICDIHGDSTITEIVTNKIEIPNSNNSDGPVEVKFFLYQHTKYVWISEEGLFATVDNLVPSLKLNDYIDNLNGLNQKEYTDRLSFFGPNSVEVEIKSYWTLFTEEIVSPFYLFQFFSVLLWIFDDYLIYAVCIIILTLFSSITSLLQTRKQSTALHDLIESSKCHEVTVLRSHANYLKIDPVQLVPDDLIVLPAGNYIMPCDAVLLTGECIVNESILTGESVPIVKTELPSGTESFSITTHKRHILFSGTTVIQTRYYGEEHVLARVVRTGFDTMKGSLVKSILFPTPVGLKFYKDSFKFVFFLFLVATTGMVYCLYLYIIRGTTLMEIFVRSLDVITIVVPPALPAAMTVGSVYSQNRLKKIGIFCISPPRINVCGNIKIVCFDKTGTLTHDGLDLNYVLACENAEFLAPDSCIKNFDIENTLIKAMATCHSLTRINGILNGDPLDINMFEFTQWELEEPGKNENSRYDILAPTIVKPLNYNIDSETNIPYVIGIIRQFPFSSTLQCMSVICRDLRQNHMIAFTKGAPEKLQNICLPESLPNNYNSLLAEYTAKGYRVIAIAYKHLSETFTWKMAQKSNRDVIECDLIFLGFLIMHNRLKTESAPVIKILHQANIRTVMITGDNILTAISVAYECEMVNSNQQILIITTQNIDNNPESRPNLVVEKVGTIQNRDRMTINFNDDFYCFAINGKTWNILVQFYPDLIPQIIVRTKIFARFQPDQKMQLILSFQNLDYIAAMIGDGANDVGALKAAHVGVSLSQAAASVAAPFTSSIENISCILPLMQEGRCAVVTSFAIFKFMALYSLIQFFSVLILYKHHSTLGNYQFLFIDLIITTILAITIGRQGPSNKLGPQRPLGSLVAAKNIIPLLLQIITCATIQILALLYLFYQPWFVPIPIKTIEPIILSWENTVLFTVSCYQYIIMATVYSKGKPFRQMLITNFWFVFSALCLTIFVTWLMIYPCTFVAELMELKPLDYDNHEQNIFRCMLLIFPVVHLVLAAFIEVCIGDKNWLKKFIQYLKRKRFPKNRYKRIFENPNYEPWLSFDNITTQGISV